MIIEDFTHVLPENKPIVIKLPRQANDKVYDLAIVNRRSKYFAEFRTQLMDIEDAARCKFTINKKLIP